MGDGERIELGVDPIDGLNSSFTLSDDLKEYLGDYGITFLHQARNLGVVSNSQSYWLTTYDLDLGGDWQV